MKASGSGNTPSLIPALRKIAILGLKTKFSILSCTRLQFSFLLLHSVPKFVHSYWCKQGFENIKCGLWGKFLFRNRSQGWFWNPRNQIILGCCFPSKIKKLWCSKPPVPLVGQRTRPLHEILIRLVITENASSRFFSNNQLCQYFMLRTGFFANQNYRRLRTS